MCICLTIHCSVFNFHRHISVITNNFILYFLIRGNIKICKKSRSINVAIMNDTLACLDVCDVGVLTANQYCRGAGDTAVRRASSWHGVQSDGLGR